ncbi:MAG: nucleotidyltransferase family protein [Eubacterium sp.]
MKNINEMQGKTKGVKQLLQEKQIWAGLILAAGLSSRMGAFKPLLPLRGKTVLGCTVDSLLAAGVSEVTVVTGYRGEELEAYLSAHYGSNVRMIRNQQYRDSDMLASVRVGLTQMAPCAAFFLLPGDMPFVSKETLQALIRTRFATGSPLVFPELDGRRKHPPLIDAALIPQIQSYYGTDGLRGLWDSYQSVIRTVPVSDTGVGIDLDTENDYVMYA